MKLLVLALSLVATSAFALSEQSSWSEIRRNPEALISSPVAGVSAFNLCATEDAFVSINPVRTCGYWEKIYREVTDSSGGPYMEYKCRHYDYRDITSSRQRTERVCNIDRSYNNTEDSYRCRSYTTRTYTMPRTVRLHVTIPSPSDENNTAFYKSYTIPSCLAAD